MRRKNWNWQWIEQLLFHPTDEETEKALSKTSVVELR
jgi:hypothetical protein